MSEQTDTSPLDELSTNDDGLGPELLSQPEALSLLRGAVIAGLDVATADVIERICDEERETTAEDISSLVEIAGAVESMWEGSNW